MLLQRLTKCILFFVDGFLLHTSGGGSFAVAFGEHSQSGSNVAWIEVLEMSHQDYAVEIQLSGIVATSLTEECSGPELAGSNG